MTTFTPSQQVAQQTEGIMQVLQARGIGPATWKTFGIHAGKGYGLARELDGFRYPTRDPRGVSRLRWKNVDRSAPDGKKYVWQPVEKDTENTWKLYTPDTKALTEAIERAGRTLYWCAGEVDVWTLHAAGSGQFPPATGVFGEKNIPDDIAETLLRWNLPRVVYYPDLDEAGMKAAAKLHRLLREAGVAHILALYHLPGEMGSKMDLNALWQQVNFDRAAFWAALKACPAITDIELYDDSLDRYAHPLPSGNSTGEKSDLPQGYYDDIARALNVTRYRSNGFSLNIKCPMHDDSTPSAAWHRDHHFLHCAVCGTVLAKDVAARVGVDYRNYLPAQPAGATRSSAPKTRAAQVTGMHVAPASAPKQDGAPAAESAPTEPPAFSLADFVMTGTEAAALYQDDIQQDTPAGDSAPVIIPFKPLHRFGGFAQVITTGMMVGVAAQTGGNKTVFLETITDAYLNTGESVLVWSPEWTARELAHRRGVRYGGVPLERVMQHRAWKYYRDHNLPVPFETIRPLTDAERAECERAVMGGTTWTADAYYIKKRRLTLDEFIAGVEQSVLAIRAQDTPLRVFVLDYAQMIRTAGDPQRRTLQDAIGMLKDLAGDLGLVVWMSSQVTKASSREASQGARVLDEASAQFLRFDEFNLALTLHMNYYPDDPIRHHGHAGQHDGTATIAVIKNNIGQKGRVTVRTDLRHLTWLDETVEPMEWHPK